jgi:plasmid stabilization system protein ParE
MPRRDDLVPGIRMAPFGRYLIFYIVAEKTIRIERILHG